MQVETDMGALATQMETDAADAVAFSITEKLARHLDKIKGEWPVRTGFSLRSFELQVRAQQSTFQGSIVNTAPYAGLIRQPGYLPEKPAERLVFNPADRVADEMARDIGEYLAEV